MKYLYEIAGQATHRFTQTKKPHTVMVPVKYARLIDASGSPGHRLRAIRAEKGVGRPPKPPMKEAA